MSVVHLSIVAPALVDQLDPQFPTHRKGELIEWGRLRLRHMLTDDGSWTFDPVAEIRFGDDFWGYSEWKATPQGSRMDFGSQNAEGTWAKQHDMNLFLWSEKPRARQAMVLLGFRPPAIRSGSSGVGTMLRGNTRITVKANPYVGPKDHQIVERTDGFSVPIRWIVAEITDNMGYNRRDWLIERK